MMQGSSDTVVLASQEFRIHGTIESNTRALAGQHDTLSIMPEFQSTRQSIPRILQTASCGRPDAGVREHSGHVQNDCSSGQVRGVWLFSANGRRRV